MFSTMWDDVQSDHLLPISSRIRATTSSNSRGNSFRSKAHQFVEGSIDTWFEYALLLVIVANVVLLIISTTVVDGSANCVHAECERFGDKYALFFEACEWTSVAIFTVEYVLRIWSCVEFPSVAAHGPLWGRIRHALTFFPLVDLLSIAPNLVYLLMLFLTETGIGETPNFTTAARVVRLVRLFKTDKYVNAFGILGTVIADNSSLLIATSFYAAMIWIICATLFFYTERGNKKIGHKFQSIPSALFPTLLMLTGNGDFDNFSSYGQIIAGFIAVVAVAIFAIPAGLLGSGFTEAIQKRADVQRSANSSAV